MSKQKELITTEEILAKSLEGKLNSAQAWFGLCRSKKLSDDAIEYFKDKVLKYCYKYQDLSEKFIDELYKNNELTEDNISEIATYQKLSEKFIRNHKKFLVGKFKYKILKYQKLSEKFIDKYYTEEYYIDDVVSKYRVSDNYINKLYEYFEKSHWASIIRKKRLSYEMLKKYRTILPWNIIDSCYELSINEIKLGAKYLQGNAWDSILKNTKLSEEDIMKYMKFFTKNQWHILSKYQDLSYKFRERFDLWEGHEF